MTFLDTLNVVVIARGFVGHDDKEAMAHARTLCRTHTIEVTHGDRLVGRIRKGGVHERSGGTLWSDDIAQTGLTQRRGTHRTR